jgi:hypothetical protein
MEHTALSNANSLITNARLPPTQAHPHQHRHHHHQVNGRHTTLNDNYITLDQQHHHRRPTILAKVVPTDISLLHHHKAHYRQR